MSTSINIDVSLKGSIGISVSKLFESLSIYWFVSIQIRIVFFVLVLVLVLVKALVLY